MDLVDLLRRDLDHVDLGGRWRLRRPAAPAGRRPKREKCEELRSECSAGNPRPASEIHGLHLLVVCLTAVLSSQSSVLSPQSSGSSPQLASSLTR
jgi:hypothetical protein